MSMRLSTRAIVMMLALLTPPALAMPGFNPDDPRYARLRAMETHGTELFENDDFAKSMSQETRNVWHQLIVDANRMKVNGLPHPLAGVATINLASMDQIEGKNPQALAGVERGLALLKPFRDAYPIPWMQGLSIKGYIQSINGDVATGAQTLVEGSDYADRHFATVDPKTLEKGDYMLKSNIAFSLGQAYSRLGRNSDAVDAQKRSMEARVTGLGPHDPDTVASYYTYAQMLFRADRNDDAEKYARLAVEVASEHVDRKHPSYVRALEMLGVILSRTGRRVESLDYLQRSIAIKRETVGTKNLFFHYALHNLGGILLPLERYDDAQALYVEAEQGFRAAEGEASPQAARALAFLGEIDLAMGRPDAAIDKLQTAITRVRTASAKDREISQRTYPYLVPALLDLNRKDAAIAAARIYADETGQLDNSPAFALANAAMMESWASGAPTRNQAAARVVTLLRDEQNLRDDGELGDEQRAALDAALAIAADTQDAALALDAMAILAGSKIAQANRLVTERLVADPVLGDRVRALQDKVKALQTADRALLRALATEGNIAATRAARDKLEQDAANLRGAIARDYPRWVEARGGAKPDLAAVQATLGKGEALLAVTPAFGKVYLLAISRTDARIERADDSRADMVALVDRLRRSMTPATMDLDAAHRLHQAFFTPGIMATLGKAHTLRIVPTGAFASLPFALLPQRPVAAIGRNSPWLIRRFAIAVQPSFTMEPDQARTRVAAARFLGVGAPLPFPASETAPVRRALLAANGYFRGGSADANALSQLPPLPGSAEEVRDVAQRFGTTSATLMLGSDASEAGLRARDLSSYSVILFATHGLVTGQMEGVTEPALVLSPPAKGAIEDGLLTASEVAQMRIGADWVILSACNTAAGDSAQAPAYSGLAQAFRYAGAGSLLVSHWPVRDDASAFVTLETVKAANAGMPRAVALQKAMLKLMRSNRPDAAQPYIWAPFILVGR
jgi:CHAT domain-containing protein